MKKKIKLKKSNQRIFGEGEVYCSFLVGVNDEYIVHLKQDTETMEMEVKWEKIGENL